MHLGKKWKWTRQEKEWDRNKKKLHTVLWVSYVRRFYSHGMYCNMYCESSTPKANNCIYRIPQRTQRAGHGSLLGPAQCSLPALAEARSTCLMWASTNNIGVFCAAPWRDEAEDALQLCQPMIQVAGRKGVIKDGVRSSPPPLLC